jgi:NADH-quinone oxidoreductase subunit E
MVTEKGIIDGIYKRYQGKKEVLTSILVDIQDRSGHLSESDLSYIAEITNKNLDDILELVKLNPGFRLKKEGRFIIEVCDGTACHLSGNSEALNIISNMLKLKPGETTENHRFTLRTVKCLGVCTRSPAMRINGKIFTNLDPKKIKDIFDEY